MYIYSIYIYVYIHNINQATRVMQDQFNIGCSTNLQEAPESPEVALADQDGPRHDQWGNFKGKLSIETHGNGETKPSGVIKKSACTVYMYIYIYTYVAPLCMYVCIYIYMTSYIHYIHIGVCIISSNSATGRTLAYFVRIFCVGGGVQLHSVLNLAGTFGTQKDCWSRRSLVTTRAMVVCA